MASLPFFVKPAAAAKLKAFCSCCICPLRLHSFGLPVAPAHTHSCIPWKALYVAACARRSTSAAESLYKLPHRMYTVRAILFHFCTARSCTQNCMRCAVAQPPPLVRPATHVYKKKCAGRLYCAEPAFIGLHHAPVLNCGRPTCETPVCFPLALRADHIANVDLYCGHAQHFQRLCFRPPVGFAKLPSCTYRPSQHNLHHNIPLPVVFAQLHLGPRRNCPLSRVLSCCWWTN